MKEKELKSVLESLLFVAEKPVSTKELAAVTGEMIASVQKALNEVSKEYEDKGIKLVRKGEYFSFVSDPTNALFVSKFLNEELSHDLTQPALETLAVITYRQPITRVEIEEIRGVNCDAILRNLMIRGLIAEVGRKETIGRPILYGTTMEFIQYFGLDKEEDIPELVEINLFENENS
jgi:segregation and condensation protein B